MSGLSVGIVPNDWQLMSAHIIACTEFDVDQPMIIMMNLSWAWSFYASLAIQLDCICATSVTVEQQCVPFPVLSFAM